MTPSSPIVPPKALRVCVAALLLAPCLLAGSSIAVLRGQATVDPTILPLVCLEIGTVGTPLVVDRLVFENLETRVEETRTLTNTFGRSHPDILTAVAPGPLSLSLPILKFRPGRYRLKSIIFVGPGTGYTLDLDAGRIWFEVKPACVNYVGGVEINADWNRLFGRFNRPVQHNEVYRVSAPTSVVCKNTVHRDQKWACDQIPGMAVLPAVASPIAKS